MASKYALLADFIEQAIGSGEYSEGSYLPGERMLCERFQVSRITVRAALKTLVRKKLIRAVVGSGYLVEGRTERLLQPRSHLIGGIFPGSVTTNQYMSVPSILFQLVAENLGDDYNLVLANSHGNLLREREVVQRLIDAGVEGLVVMPAFSNMATGIPHEMGNYALFQELYRKGLPIVLLDRSLTRLNRVSEELPAVYNDDIRIGEMQTEEMIGRGFRRIIFHDSIKERIGFLRHAGYRRAMQAARLTPLQVAPDKLLLHDLWLNDPEAMVRAYEALKPLITEDTALVTSCFGVPALERLFPDGRWQGHRVQWVCSDFKAGWGNLTLRKYPCITRPIQQIGVLGAQKMLHLLAGDRSVATADYLPPAIEY